MACVALGGLLFILGAVATAAVRLFPLLPGLFFAAPENHTFASSAQRAAVAMTRLTVFQSVMLPVFFFWASLCFCNLPRLQDCSLYERSASSRLIVYRIVFLCFLACSAAVSVGATVGHGADAYGVAASLAVTGCLGWFAWAVGKRLMAVRWPPWILSPHALAGVFLILYFALVPLFMGVWFGPHVLSVSRYLKWLGPAGWVNELLLDLSIGETRNLWPLGICCIAAVVLGYRLNGPTKTWSYRRRLLSIYRTRESFQRAPSRRKREDRVALDLRETLSGRGWRSVLYPQWAEHHLTFLLVSCGSLLLVQLFLVGVVLFLKAVEQEAGMGETLHETRMLCVAMASAAGINVLLMEGFAASYRDQPGLAEFARRPVSPDQVWRQLQLAGVRFALAQILLSIPFVAVTIVVAPAYWMNSCFAVIVALLSCIAIRTALPAGASYYSSVIRLRPWLAIPLIFGMFAGGFLILGTVVSAFVLCLDPDASVEVVAVRLLLQQVAPLAVFGIAWGIWFAVGHSAKEVPLACDVG